MTFFVYFLRLTNVILISNFRVYLNYTNLKTFYFSPFNTKIFNIDKNLF